MASGSGSGGSGVVDDTELGALDYTAPAPETGNDTPWGAVLAIAQANVAQGLDTEAGMSLLQMAWWNAQVILPWTDANKLEQQSQGAQVQAGASGVNSEIQGAVSAVENAVPSKTTFIIWGVVIVAVLLLLVIFLHEVE